MFRVFLYCRKWATEDKKMPCRWRMVRWSYTRKDTETGPFPSPLEELPL